MSFSRLGNHDRNKIIKQTLLFSLGGCAIIAFFVFGLLPFYTHLLMGNSTQSKLPTATPTVNIPSPSLIASFSATNSAQISVKGSAQANIDVRLGINGSLDLKTTASGTGDFTFDGVTLVKGDNLLVAYAEDSNGNRSTGSLPLTVTYSTDAPKLDVTSPTDNSLVTQRKQSVITVSGQTDPGSKVYLNDQFLFVTETGSFTGSFQLVQGSNLLHLRSDNAAGNESTKDLHINYIP